MERRSRPVAAALQRRAAARDQRARGARAVGPLVRPGGRRRPGMAEHRLRRADAREGRARRAVRPGPGARVGRRVRALRDRPLHARAAAAPGVGVLRPLDLEPLQRRADEDGSRGALIAVPGVPLPRARCATPGSTRT